MKLFTREQLTEALKAHTLDNLQEKDYKNCYIDVFYYMMKDTPEIFNKIAEDLAEKVKEYKFEDNSNPSSHPFINCEKELATEMGFDSITVCPYKGQIHCDWLDSNYMVQCCDDKLSMMIDIYNTYEMEESEVKDLILQEMWNFYRDMQWCIDGVYEQKMEEMRRRIEGPYNEKEKAMIDEMKDWSAEEQARYLCPNGVMTLEEFRKLLHDMIDEVYDETEEENEQK